MVHGVRAGPGINAVGFIEQRALVYFLWGCFIIVSLSAPSLSHTTTIVNRHDRRSSAPVPLWG